jgi:hypothetical protein
MSDIGDKSEIVSEVFFRDGSLRDIYILDCGLADWEIAAAFLDREYELRFDGAWTGGRFPSPIAGLFLRSASSAATLLEISLGEVILCCHFFSEEEIEFDLNPNAVTDIRKAEEVLNFMRGLAGATGKDVILTPENMRKRAMLRVTPGQDVQRV